MKNINLILSILFLFSKGMAASSEAREQAPEPSWVRAAAVETVDERYEILKNATDHQITLPSFKECAKVSFEATYPVLLLSGDVVWQGMFGSEPIQPIDLSNAIQNELDTVSDHFKVKIFMAVYNASKVIYLQDKF